MQITVKDLTKEYKCGKRIFKAVDTVNLSLMAGDFVSIIGKSGSGKSTLFNIIAGLTKPTSGSVEINGKTLPSFSDQELSLYRNEIIGYVPQGQSILTDFNVLDNVRLPFHLTKRQGGSADRAHELLRQVGIEHLAENYPKHLSGGELKRVAIARSLINNPDVLIADEPTGELDTQTTAEVLLLLNSITKNGKAVLMVTHDLNAVGYSTRSYVMESGVLTSDKIGGNL